MTEQTTDPVTETTPAPGTKKSDSKRRPGPFLVILLILLLLAMLNWQFGLGSGDEGDTDGKPPQAPAQSAVEGEQDTGLAIVVKGETCTLNGAEPTACAGACAAVTASGRKKDSAIAIDGTHGVHAVVETLVSCLGQAGYSKVTTTAGSVAPAADPTPAAAPAAAEPAPAPAPAAPTEAPE